jgi:hypothetical protein
VGKLVRERGIKMSGVFMPTPKNLILVILLDFWQAVKAGDVKEAATIAGLLLLPLFALGSVVFTLYSLIRWLL